MKIWVDAQLPPTFADVTNRNLRRLLSNTLSKALEKLQEGEMIVEISSNP